MKKSTKEPFASNKKNATAESKKSNGAIMESTNPNLHMKKTKKSSTIQVPIETTPIATTNADVKMPIDFCGVPELDNINGKLKPIEWGEVEKSLNDAKELCAVYSVEQLLQVAYAEHTPLVECGETLYYFAGSHYKPTDTTTLNRFLIGAALKCKVSYDMAVCYSFIQKAIKQVLMNATRYNEGIVAPSTTYLNLKNGTLFLDESGRRFVPHSSKHFIRYCLGFDYDKEAKAPLWKEHLERSLPDPEKQAYLAECLALPFFHGKIEKAVILHGQQNTGKSTTLDVYKALIGSENCSGVTLAALARTTDTGDYMRSMLNGKLVNVASDVGDTVADSGLVKTLISREKLAVRNIGKQPYDMDTYARIVCAMNKLPLPFFSDPALTRRLAIILFDQQIETADVQIGFTDAIIANELPGVLNWILEGLDRLLQKGRLDPPACCVAEMELMKVEVDQVSSWLDEKYYQKGDSETVSVKSVYPDFEEFCKENGYRGKEIPTKPGFVKQLRDMGYKVERLNGRVGTVLYFAKANP